MNIELWTNVKIVDESATATKRLLKIVLVGLVTAILLMMTIGHTKTMDKNTTKEMEILKERIKKHEGFKLLPYQLEYTDAHGNDIKEDFWTGGHGIKLGKDHKAPEGGYTDEYWNKKFNERFTEAHNGALKLVGTDMDYRVTGVLTEIIYQIGYTGVSKFKNTLKYMENGQWDLASNEMLNSKWAVQTPQRAKDLAKIIKNIR